MSLVTICDVCGGETWDVVVANVMGRGVDLRRCRACGFKTYDRVLVDAADFYTAPPYDDYARRSFIFRSSVIDRQRDDLVAENEAGARGAYRDLLDHIEAAVQARPIRLYEVGCGWGRLLDVARERDDRYEARGCDLSPAEAANGRSLGLDVEAGDFYSLPIVGHFDAVVVLDVLEHVWRPRALVERAVSLLAPGGGVLVKTFYDEWHATLPNLDLSEGAETTLRMGKTTGYYGPVAHPSHFDAPVLRDLFRRVGLEIVWEHMEPIWGQIALLGRRA